MEIKKEFRIIGIDDGHFVKSQDSVIVIGTIFRGGQWMDGVLSTKVKVDGDDATDKLAEMINRSRHIAQLKCIMLNGIALGGFNVIDIPALSKKTKLPVIVMTRKMPDFKKIEQALEKSGAPEKMALIKKAGKVHGMKLHLDKEVHFQFYGLSKEAAEGIIRVSATRSLIPEPIRAAHIIASGVTMGESKKRV